MGTGDLRRLPVFTPPPAGHTSASGNRPSLPSSGKPAAALSLRCAWLFSVFEVYSGRQPQRSGPGVDSAAFHAVRFTLFLFRASRGSWRGYISPFGATDMGHDAGLDAILRDWFISVLFVQAGVYNRIDNLFPRSPLLSQVLRTRLSTPWNGK